MDFCKQDILLILAGAAVGILIGIFYLRYEELSVHINDSNKIAEMSIKISNIEDKLNWINFIPQ